MCPISADEFEAGVSTERKSLDEVMERDKAYTTKTLQGTILSQS